MKSVTFWTWLCDRVFTPQSHDCSNANIEYCITEKYSYETYTGYKYSNDNGLYEDKGSFVSQSQLFIMYNTYTVK